MAHKVMDMNVWAIVIAFVLVAFILLGLMVLDPLADDQKDDGTVSGYPAERRNRHD